MVDKRTHAEAGYHKGRGPTGSHCSICRFYIADGPHCHLVVDPIYPDDGCRLYQPRRHGSRYLGKRARHGEKVDQ